jgi:predicted aconitase with swiveling domain
MTVLHGRGLVGGIVEGEALVSTETISGWGGVDPMTGTIIETRHPLRGVSFAGKLLVFRGAKGSSGWSVAFHGAAGRRRAGRAGVCRNVHQGGAGCAGAARSGRNGS